MVLGGWNYFRIHMLGQFCFVCIYSFIYVCSAYCRIYRIYLEFIPHLCELHAFWYHEGCGIKALKCMLYALVLYS